LQPAGLHPVDGCGFGCVLVKSEIIRKIGYPQFVYKSALDHRNTISEDVYFCTRARQLGFQIFADSTIVCNHIGNTVFVPKDIMSDEQQKNYLRHLSTWDFRKEDVDYLKTMKKHGVNPKVIYDIGACTGNWTREARKIWDNSNFVLFDAMPQVEFLLKETGFDYHIGVLSDVSHKEVEFFENVWQPGGNSYYREIGHPESGRVFSDAHKVKKTTHSLDDVVRYNNFPLPDMMKIDVQGCEIDVLKGAEYTLSKCTDLLIELQHTEYNQGAPLKDEAIEFLKSIGFKQKYALPATPFDGDYHFVRV
jgi:FkbM family methyltransferase